VLNPATGALRYSTCGHPAPLVVSSSGATRFLAESGAGPLGTGSVPLLAEDVLEPAALVLLYSDGLIERPDRTLPAGMAELAEVAKQAAANRTLPAGSGTTRAERVCQLTVELLTRTGYADDVTTLAAQRFTTSSQALHQHLPADPDILPDVREAFDVWLDQFEPALDDRHALQLGIGEMITNAIEHAYPPNQPGTIEVHAELQADGQVECRISDQGSWREPRLSDATRGHGLVITQQLLDHLELLHPVQDADEPHGARGTIVKLRHRLRRPAMLASTASTRAMRRPLRLPFGTAIGNETVRVWGPVDIVTADQLTRDLLVASRGGVLPLTVDLTAVTHLASAGVRALHQLQRQLADQQQNLTLLAAQDSPAHAILELVHLSPISPEGS
jgi:anti-sigma regulatory factor (Ser/Thr protein kinase)/anti-anti-sigma regulatory factor